jgi:hypothetical protein
LWLAAAGTGTGWRRATASLSLDGGASWRTLGVTAPPAVMGVAIEAVGAGPVEAFDRVHAIEIETLHDGMILPSGGDAALIEGRNLALIGDELIAFADATQIAPRRWRLSGLLRGRFGTHWAMAWHGAGDRFVLIETGRLLPIELSAATIGGNISVSAFGPGDAGPPAMRSAIVIGRALRPPSPVALSARRLSNGAIRINWIRRSRTGWSWLDGADAPLGEDRELYRLTLSSDGADRVIEPDAPTFDYPADEQPPGLLAGTSPLTASVVQLGRFGSSLAAAMQTFLL